jgi:subfamily B ATP-binding cassette protein MsbA
MYSEFFDLFLRRYGGLPKGIVVVFLIMAISVLEGLNIGLLIPLLESLQSTGEGESHWISNIVANSFDKVGIPFQLWTILLALGVLIIVISALKYLRIMVVAGMTRDFTVWLRTGVMRDLLHADISYFHTQQLGKLTDTLSTQTQRAGNTLSLMGDIIASCGIIFAYLAAAFFITPVLAAVAFAMLFMVSLMVQHLVQRARTISKNLVQNENNFQAAGLENLSGIQLVKSFLLERPRSEAYADAARQVGDSLYELEKNRSRVLVLQELSLFGLIGGIVLVGVSWLSLDITLIVTLLFVLYRLMPRITSINAQRQSLALGLASIQNIKQTTEDPAMSDIVSGKNPFVKIRRSIELEEVNFSYNGGAQVLNNTSFTIEVGKTTAIVGTSGAGKTTLIDLMLRFYDPLQGRLLIDGVDLKELDLQSWRRSVGVVSQDIFLFNDTISANIGLGRPEATQEAVIVAAQQAYAHEFIQRLPENYQTRVGDRGWNLSGGQSQRIAIARAILNKPDILILDEATSSLDSESEQLIQRYMKEIRGTCTMVVVAHRMSTIQDADKIVVLQDGKIVEEGNYENLLANGGIFANYHHLQSTGSPN